MSKLNSIAEGKRISDVYSDEKRDWMDNVDDNAIYEEIGTHEFQVWGNLFVTEVTDEPTLHDAA